MNEEKYHELWTELKDSYWSKGKIFKIEDIVNPEFYTMVAKYNLPFGETIIETFADQWYYFLNGAPKGYTEQSWNDHWDDTNQQLYALFPNAFFRFD